MTAMEVYCEVCGPQDPPTVHVLCHDRLYMIHGLTTRTHGCGHPLADHSDGLKCRTCARECGIDCRTVEERVAEYKRDRALGPAAAESEGQEATSQAERAGDVEMHGSGRLW